MWKWLLVTLVFILIVVELVFFAPQPGDRVRKRDWRADTNQRVEKDVEQVLRGAHLIESKGETKLWELDAQVAHKKMKSEGFEMDGVEVRFYGEKEVYYNAIGHKGFVGENQKKLKISGDVEILSSNGYVLNTEVVFYNTGQRTIYGPGEVRLLGPGKNQEKRLHMRADRFETDFSTNVIHLQDNVRGQKRMEEGRKMTIRSQEALFRGDQQIGIFKKDVIIKVDSMTLLGQRAQFIYKAKKLHSVLIDGGVRIKDMIYQGWAGEIEVFVQENKCVFRDQPKLLQGENRLLGTEIIAYDSGNRVVVKKGSTTYQTTQQTQEK